MAAASFMALRSPFAFVSFKEWKCFCSLIQSIKAYSSRAAIGFCLGFLLNPLFRIWFVFLLILQYCSEQKQVSRPYDHKSKYSVRFCKTELNRMKCTSWRHKFQPIPVGLFWSLSSGPYKPISLVLSCQYFFPDFRFSLLSPKNEANIQCRL